MIVARRKCGTSPHALCLGGVRLLATGGGDGKQGGGKDFSIDFNALFKSVGNKAPADKKDGAVEPIDFKKLFSQSSATSPSSPGEKFKLDLGRSRAVDNEKLKVDLSKLFGDSSPSSSIKPGQGGLKGFKLDLSKLKGQSEQGGGGGTGLLKRPPGSKEANEEARLETLQKLVNKFNIVMGPGSTALPPKDHLVESYFATENKSLAEVRRAELTKIREEFKLHESDCGSSPVQIAALTKKIKFMAQHFMLHKKDIHSRRGLNGMVQRRRKLLIYLRRTNWEMYCHVITRLGLKDNLEVPDAARKTSSKNKKFFNKGRKRKKKKLARRLRPQANSG